MSEERNNRHIDTHKAIELLQETLKIKYSDEQCQILEASMDRPTLVNACAGSGKTTLFLSKIIVEGLTQRQVPREVLGITFSKKAQEDMQKRYDSAITKLQDKGINIPNGKPTFLTFHAFFFSLLRKDISLSKVTVYDYTHFTKELYSKLNTYGASIPKHEYLEKIFEVYDSVIGNWLSTDGIHLNQQHNFIKKVSKSDESEIEEIIPFLNVQKPLPENFVKNYKSVIAEYNRLKRKYNVIDFGDMGEKLFERLCNKNTKNLFMAAVSKYTQVYMDEFQDINSLQWINMKTLFANKAGKHFFVIGDDDQSIYSFRGSNPKYIISFPNTQENAQVFKLSTNYRTGGKILDSCIPMITENQARMEKQLKAFNDGSGSIKIIDTDEGFADNPFLRRLVNTIEKPNVGSIAILTRFNNPKALITDYLATKKIYPSSYTDTHVLSKNPIFCDITELMKIIDKSNIKKFVNSPLIGFTPIRKYLKQTYQIAQDERKEFKNIVDFLSFAKHAIDTRNSSGEQSDSKVIYRIDLLIESLDDFFYMKGQNNTDRFTNRDLLNTLWLAVREIIDPYYTYMASVGRVSKQDYFDMLSYINYLVGISNSLEDLIFGVLNRENRLKRHNLGNNGQKNNLTIMTLHQSKGLEYDNVFIYALNNRHISDEKMLLWGDFPPSLTSDELKRMLFDMAKSKDKYRRNELLHEFALMSLCGVTGLDVVWRRIFDKDKCLREQIVFDEEEILDKDKQDLEEHRIKILSQLASPQFIKDSSLVFFFNNADFENFYLRDDEVAIILRSLNTITGGIEEARRLFYVGITRAKKLCVIENRDKVASPLIKELKPLNSRNKKETCV